MKSISLLVAVLIGLLGSVGARADLIKASSTYYRCVLMTSSTDHVTGDTGLTLTITESKAGGAYGAATPTVTERGNGVYAITLTSADDATIGCLAMHITGTGGASAADASDTLDQVVAFDPGSATNLGLSALPTANPNASGGVLTVGVGAGQITPDGTGAVPISLAQTIPSNSPPTANTVAAALFYASQKFGRVNTAQAGSSTTITLDAGASATDNAYQSHMIKIYYGTGAGQFATIVSYVGSTKVATITRPGTGQWTTTPDNTSVFWIEPESYVTVESSLDKGGYSLSGSQTFNLTGNITGNLSGTVGSVTGNVGGITGITIPSTIPSLAQIEAGLLATPGNLLATDSSGRVLLQPTQSGVTIPTVTAIGGITGTTLPATVPSLAQIQAGLPTDGSVATDVQTGLTAQGYTTTRGPYLDKLNSYLTGDAYVRLGAPAGASVSADIAAVKSDTAGVATLLTRLPGALTVTSGGVTIAGYAAGQDPGTSVWSALTASFNAANTFGHFVQNIAGGGGSDPWATAYPGSYASGTFGYAQSHPADTAGTTTLLTRVPSALTVTSGGVTVAGYAGGQDPATLLLSATVDGGLTLRQIQSLSEAILAGSYAIARNSTAKTITVTYYRPANPSNTTTVLAVMVTTYSDTALTQPVSRSSTFSNLP